MCRVGVRERGREK
jgi:hypothetical protein